ncbi:hypothetical protein T8T21_00225 [Limimaricola variabilis]|uniref:hypothetical protein n=1 Tax=Limimaricola variabilis TaxID=1492771 RepID=UPI002AC9EB9F|nr:hypothetical protein [Limimaricola variabilis]WPY94587.1 hypothetical protein T8T21_00225 [Limimaricola variabilis]
MLITVGFPIVIVSLLINAFLIKRNGIGLWNRDSKYLRYANVVFLLVSVFSIFLQDSTIVLFSFVAILLLSVAYDIKKYVYLRGIGSSSEFRNSSARMFVNMISRLSTKESRSPNP